MRLHVAQVVILRRLLFFVSHVDEDVETVTVTVAVDNRQPLLFMFHDQPFGSGRAAKARGKYSQIIRLGGAPGPA